MSSSSSSDSDDIEIDGFPPELANNARFTSLKSNNDSLPSLKIYVPLDAATEDIIPTEIVKTCIRILKHSSNMSERERQQLLEQLENQMNNNFDSLKCDKEWHSKSNQTNLRAHSLQKELSKSSCIKVNIEIPSANHSSNNIKYSFDKPLYDPEQLCWKTSMDFLLQHGKDSILECQNEVFQENKQTQTDNDFQIKPESYFSLSRPIAYDTRCRSEEKLVFPDIYCLEGLTPRFSTSTDISELEKIEKSFSNEFDKITFSHFKISYRNYKNIIQNSIDKYSQDLMHLKSESENLIQKFYEHFNESQFKRHAQNQLLIVDIEKQIYLVDDDMKLKNESLDKILKSVNKRENIKLENEIRKSNFSYSIRLISQMIFNLKLQVTSLSKEIQEKVK